MVQSTKTRAIYVVWFELACSQHFAGLPGGRVGGQGLAPGGVGGQLALMVSVEEVLSSALV